MKRIALVSGGIDSTVMALQFSFFRNVYIDTKTGYNEQEMASLRRNGIEFDVIQFPISAESGASGGFSPLRNLLLICLVLNRYDADEVWLAGLRDDEVADKNADIFERYSDVISRSLERPVLIHSPYFGLSKGEVVQSAMPTHAKKLYQTFSCYSPIKGAECGQCKACFRKWVALSTNGIPSSFSQGKVGTRIIAEYLSHLHEYDTDRQSRIMIALKTLMSVYAIDLDGTLCAELGPYSEREPISKSIKRANELFGFKVIFTARLESDRRDTVLWLQDNGVNYDALVMNKLPFNLLIDDLAITAF